MRAAAWPAARVSPHERLSGAKFDGMKEKGTAYIMWAGWFMGAAGLQRLYAGKIGTGLLYLFTWGLFGVGQIIDLFLIPKMVEEANMRLALEGVDPALIGRGGAAALLG